MKIIKNLVLLLFFVFSPVLYGAVQNIEKKDVKKKASIYVIFEGSWYFIRKSDWYNNFTPLANNALNTTRRKNEHKAAGRKSLLEHSADTPWNKQPSILFLIAKPIVELGRTFGYFKA